MGAGFALASFCFFASSVLTLSAGAVATSAGFASTGFASTALASAGFVSAALLSEAFAADASASEGLVSAGFDTLMIGGADGTLSILKSSAVGGGTFAGSGIGTAASIASSVVAFFAVSVWASAAEVETVRQVAAGAISIRSKSGQVSRVVSHSRTPWVKLSRHGTIFRSFRPAFAQVLISAFHGSIMSIMNVTRVHFGQLAPMGPLTTN